MSNTPGLPAEENEGPFVDPWLHESSHQGDVPVDALFLGAWESMLCSLERGSGT